MQLTWEQLQNARKDKILKRLEEEDKIEICEACGMLKDRCVCNLSFIDRIEVAGIDQRCNADLAVKILGQVANWEGYSKITVKTIKESFNINEHTAQKVYRLLKKIRKDIKFPERTHPSYLISCCRCGKGYWAKSDEVTYQKMLCKECLSKG